MKRRKTHILVERWGETTHLAVLDGTQVLFVEKLQAMPATTIMLSRVSAGSCFSAHGLAVGKVLLAYQAWFSLPTVLEKLELTAYTDHTITTCEQLIQELEDARRQGYACDHEEVTQGVCCVAAPIFDRDGRVPVAISFCIPAYRFFLQEDHYTEVIVRMAQSISEKLGYRVKGTHTL
jgi:DNA-binding IclR family transcriptional regulator